VQPPASRRRWIIVAVVAAVVLIATAITVGFVVTRDDPAAEFEAAAETFKSTYDEKSKSLRANLAKAGPRAMDPGLQAAQADAKALGDAYTKYGQEVAGLDLPAAAQPGKDELVRAAEAGTFLMTNAAGFFFKGAMESALTELWPQVTNKLLAAEAALRKALE
jgi:hypothetical protein